MVLEKRIGNTRGVTKLHDGRAMVLVTNFRQEPQHLTKGTAVDQIEEPWDTAAITALLGDPSSSQHQRTPPSKLDIDRKFFATERTSRRIQRVFRHVLRGPTNDASEAPHYHERRTLCSPVAV